MKTKEKTETIRHIPASKIIAAPSSNPRFCADGGGPQYAEAAAQKFFKSREFKALYAALNATGGPTVPVVVEDLGDGSYNLLDGWGRHEWAKRQKRAVKLPAIVKPKLSDAESMTIRVALNTARNGYDPLAEGAAYVALVGHYGAVNAVAKIVGRPCTVVNERVRLYRLPKTVLNLYRAGHLMLSAAEVFFRIDGNLEYTRGQNGEALSADDQIKATSYERTVGIMVSEIADRITKSGGRKTFSRGAVKSIYNRAIGKAATRRGGNYLRIDAGRIERHAPEQVRMDRFMLVYGDMIVRELLSDDPNNDIVETCSDDIVILGVGRGLSCPLDLVEFNTDDDNQPVYPPEVAQALNRALVRRVVAQAYLLRSKRMLPHGHELTKTQASWEQFLHNSKNLQSMLATIESVTVPVPASTVPACT